MKRLALLAASAVLLSMSFAPTGQYYLAWVALAPWLVVVGSSRTRVRGFLWGFVGGFLFNGLAYTWLYTATLSGTIGLIVYLSLFWGTIALIVRSARLLEPGRRNPLAAMLLIGTIWAGAEWFRGWLFTGFPWLFLAHSQSPLIAMCQVADLGSVFVVSFWLMCANALVAMLWINRARWQTQWPAITGCGVVLAVVLMYGLWRVGQQSTSSYPGPRVMVVQSDFKHKRGGAKTVTWQEQEQFHFEVTRKGLSEQTADLVVWSETVLPPMNPEARRMTRDPRLSTGIHDDLVALCQQNHASVLFGAYTLLSFKGQAENADVRNSTYFYTPTSQEERYDKIHLVPFAEILPFKQSIPWLYRLLWRFAAYSVDYPINPAAESEESLRVFVMRDSLPNWKFVTPICFEDIDSRLMARMFRPGPNGNKRADFIVNVTNDGWFNGWFKGREKWQHLQSAIFRSIENRTPTARADNTGISGFVDSVGRTEQLMLEGTSGASVRQLLLDRRVTFYSRYGDVFGIGCAIVAVVLLILNCFSPRKQSRGTDPVDAR